MGPRQKQQKQQKQQNRNPATRQPRDSTIARRTSILAGALNCFGELGVDATTIGDIQQAANCSVGSLYHHFGSKEGIMIRKLKRCKTAESGVKGVVRFYCDWTVRNRALASYLHSRDIDFSDEAKERLRRIHRSYIFEVYTLFARHVESGEMRILPLDTYVPLISGPIQEYTRRWLSGQFEADSRSIPKKMRELFADAAWKVMKA
jgi:AcrR family transcriptional regulator